MTEISAPATSEGKQGSVPHHHDPNEEPLPFEIRSPESNPNSMGTFRFDEAPSYMHFREESSMETPHSTEDPILSTPAATLIVSQQPQQQPQEEEQSRDSVSPLQLSGSEQSTPAHKTTRKASATIVMNGGGTSAKRENMTPTARAALTAVSSSSQSNSAAGSPSRRMFSLGTVQIKSTAVVDVIQKHLSLSNSSSLSNTDSKKGPPIALPTELKLPMPLRCDFCQKFDSVCSQCHFRWKGIAESRRAVFQNQFQGLPLERRVPTLFSTIAYGDVAFAKVVFEPLSVALASVNSPTKTSSSNTSSASLNTVLDELEAEFTPFFVPQDDPLDDDEAKERQLAFVRAGAVFPLHVACGMRRLAMAKLLLELGVTPCRSTHRISPFDMLPSPLPAEWHDMLEEFPSYRHFVACDNARALRLELRLDEALAIYDAVLAENAYHEVARCGRAKTLYDLNRFQDCMIACDEIAKDESRIKWLSNVPANVELLRAEAADQLCEVSHADTKCSSALKACGCIIIPETFRVSVRRLPFAILRDHILPFSDCKVLWHLRRATRAPLLHRVTEQLAASQGIESIGVMLAAEFGYREMYDTIVAETPEVAQGSNALLKAPTVFLALQVIAMADFHTFLLRAAVVGGNPKYVAEGSSFFGFGKRSEESKRSHLVVLKQFRVNRAGIGKAWEVARAGEWEVDLATTDVWLKSMHLKAAKAVVTSQ